jgi:hypothetical protein
VVGIVPVGGHSGLDLDPHEPTAAELQEKVDSAASFLIAQSNNASRDAFTPESARSPSGRFV